MKSLLDKKLIPTKDAAKHTGYNPDYLARLCREGKIDAMQVGRTWLVSQDSLEEFVKHQEEQKAQLREKLSEMREQEYKKSQSPIAIMQDSVVLHTEPQEKVVEISNSSEEIIKTEQTNSSTKASSTASASKSAEAEPVRGYQSSLSPLPFFVSENKSSDLNVDANVSEHERELDTNDFPKRGLALLASLVFVFISSTAAYAIVFPVTNFSVAKAEEVSFGAQVLTQNALALFSTHDEISKEQNLAAAYAAEIAAPLSLVSTSSTAAPTTRTNNSPEEDVSKAVAIFATNSAPISSTSKTFTTSAPKNAVTRFALENSSALSTDPNRVSPNTFVVRREKIPSNFTLAYLDPLMYARAFVWFGMHPRTTALALAQTEIHAYTAVGKSIYVVGENSGYEYLTSIRFSGSVAYALGTDIATIAREGPEVVAYDETRPLVAYVHLANGILTGYSDGIYAWVGVSQEVPPATIAMAYSAGLRTEYAVGKTEAVAIASYENTINYTGTTGHLALVNGEDAATHSQTSHSIKNVASIALATPKNIPAQTEDFLLGLLGNTSLALKTMPTKISIHAPLSETAAVVNSLASDVIPTLHLTQGEQVALGTYYTVNNLFFNLGNQFAVFLGVPSSTIAVVPNSLPIPVPTGPSVAMSTPIVQGITKSSVENNLAHNAELANEANGNGNGTSHATTIQYVYNTNGVSQQYVDDAVAGLRTLLLEQTNALADSVSGDSGNSGNSTGGTGGNYSGIAITGSTFTGGSISTGDLSAGSTTLQSLVVSSSTYLNDVTSASSTVTGNQLIEGSLTINGNVYAPNLPSGLGTTSQPYFIATSTTATSTFAGAVNIGNGGFVYSTSSRTVGIGTTSPGATLGVAGSGYFDGSVTATNITATGTAYLANASITQATISSATITNATFSNASSTNFFAQLLSATTGIFDNLSATLATITGLTTTNSTSTNATSTNLYATNSFFDNLLATIANFTTAFIGNLTATNAVLTNATSTNATSTNLAVSNENVTHATIGNELVTNGTTTNLAVTNEQVTNGTTTNLTVTNTNIGSTTIGSASIINATITNATSTNLYASNSFFDNLIATIANVTTAFIGNLTATSAILTNATTTNATSTNLVVANEQVTNGTTTNFAATNANLTNEQVTNQIVTNGTTTNLTVTNLTVGSTTVTNTNIGSTSIGNATIGSASITNATITNAVLTNASSTNFFASLLSATNGIFNNLTATLATITGLTTTNSTSTNATTTNAYNQNLYADNGTITNLSNTNASSTNLYASNLSSDNANIGALSIGNLNGVLTATNGAISSGLVDLTSQVANVLPTTNGGTGFNSYTPGVVLISDENGNLEQLSQGSPNQVLKVGSDGVPYWGVDETIGAGGSDGIFATSTNLIYPLNTSNVLLVGTNATSSNSSVFEVDGNSYFGNGNVGIGTTTPSQLLSIGGNVIIGAATAGGTNGTLTYGGVTLANSVTGTGSMVLSASPTFTGAVRMPVIAGGTAVGSTLTLEGTTNANPTSRGNIFFQPSGGITDAVLTSGGVLGIGTTSPLSSGLDIASSSAGTTFRDQLVLTDTSAGTNLKHVGFGVANGTLSIDTINDSPYATTSRVTLLNGGNFGIGTTTPGSLLSVGGVANFSSATSTFYGSGINLLNGCYAVNGVCIGTDATQLANFGVPFYQYFHATTTNALAEGTNNLYFTNARADARINATSTIGTLLSAPNLGTVNTSLTGFLKATAGALSTSLINLTTDISGILPVGNGGTGSSSYSTNGVLYGNGTSPLLATSQGGTNTVLVANNGAPSFSSAITVGTSVTSPILNATTGYQLNGTNITTPGTLANIAYQNGTNTFSGTNSFTGSTTLINATSTSFQTSILGLGSSYFTSLTGNGLIDSNGVLSIATTSIGSGFFAQGGNSFGTTATFGTIDNNPLNIETHNIVRATFDTLGNFGIGSTSPAATLGVNGGAFISGNANVGSLSIGSLNGILKAVNGVVTTATGGTDYEYPLTFSTGLNRTGNIITNTGVLSIGTDSSLVASQSTGSVTLSLNTANANTFSALQQFNGNASTTQLTVSGKSYLGALSAANATTTSLFTNTLGLGNGNYFTSLLGNGLVNNNGVLSVSTTTLGSGFFAQGGNSFGTAAILGTTDNNALTFITNNIERARFDTSGNLGIGITVPTAKLDVAGSINIDQYSSYKQAGTSILYASSTLNSITVGVGSPTATGNQNTIIGIGAGTSLTTGSDNFFGGYDAGVGATTTVHNIAIGSYSLAGFGASNTSGQDNVGVGYRTLNSNSSGNENVALGSYSLSHNTTGSQNLAIGNNSLVSNTTGGNNIGIGNDALANGSSYDRTVAIGSGALSNINGSADDVAIGNGSGQNATAGNDFVAIGSGAGSQNQNPNQSVLIGSGAGRGTFSGLTNQGVTAIGYQAGINFQTGSDYNTLIGYLSGNGITTGSRNVLIGQSTISASENQVTSGSNNIAIGNDVAVPSATANNQLDIGNEIYGIGLNGTGLSLSTGSIGIGTTTPAATFAVAGNSFISGTETANALTIGSLTGILKATGGVVGTATGGTDYEFPLTFSTGLNRTGNIITNTGVLAISTDGSLNASQPSGNVVLSLNTANANTFSALQTFNGGLTLGTFNGPLQANNGVVSATTSIGALYGGTGSTTLSGILIGNGTNPVNTLTVGTGLTLTGTTLSSNSSGTVGTGTTGQVPYYAANGTALTATSSIYIGLNGNVGIDSPTTNAQLGVGGTLNPVGGGSESMELFGVTGNSSVTSNWGLNVANTFASTSAATSVVYGLRNVPTISTNNVANLSNFSVYLSTPTIASSYTNTISNAYGYLSNTPSNNSVPGTITNFAGFAENPITNGDGITSGTISNTGFQVGTITASSSVGGIINNYAANFIVPAGAPNGGTTNDYGLYISGAGGSSANGGTEKHYSIYDNSSANSYFAGSLGLGTTSPAALLSVQGNALFSGNLSLASLTATGTATIGSLAVSGTATSTFAGGVSLPNLALTNNSGILKASTGGYIINAIGGTDYEFPLTFSTGLNRTGNIITNTGVLSIATDGSLNASSPTGALTLSLNTSNANTFPALQQFNGNASTTQLTVTGNTYLAMASGKVGIGTTSPATTLSVLGNGYITGGLGIGTVNTTSGTVALSSISGTNGGYRLLDSTGTTRLAMHLNASGNTGVIDLFDPAGNNTLEFHGNGNSYVNASTTPFNFGVGTSTPKSILTVGGNTSIGADYNVAAPTNGLIVEGNVGIGTSSPLSVLDIGTNLTGLGPSAGVAIEGSGAGVAPSVSTALYINGTFIPHTGLRGIGVTPTISTNTSASMQGIYVKDTVPAGVTVSQNTYDLYLDTPSIGGTVSGSQYALYSADTNNSYFAGNVGIGTTTPSSALAVQGNALFSGNLSLANLTATGTATVGNIVNNGVTANSLIYVNGSNQESAVTVGTGLAFSGGTLTATGGGAGVSTVSNSDGTLTISPTNGSVVASLNLAHANTFTGLQQFNGNASTTQLTVSGPSYLGGALTYGGVTLANSVTGTGSMVLSAAPTFTGNATFGGAIRGGTGAGSVLTIDGTTNTSPTAGGGISFAPGNTHQTAFFQGSNGGLALGTTSTPWILDVATSSASSQFDNGQLAITDTNAGTNLKHWLFSNESGNLYIGTTSDAYASSTVPALSLLSNSYVGIGSSSPASKLTVVGSACISQGIGATIACGTAPGNIYYGTANTGAYDVAENYLTNDPNAVPGTIVALDTSSGNENVETAAPDATVLGVVSTHPGLVLGGADAGEIGDQKVPVALSGRVPTRVTMQNGPINVGDRIMLSSTPGVGMKATGSGETVGIALQSASTDGSIDVFVQPQYYFSPNDLAVGADGNVIIGGTEATGTNETGGATGNFNQLGVNDIQVTGSLQAQGISATSVSATGTITAGSVTASGTVTANDVNASGTVSAADVNLLAVGSSTPAQVLNEAGTGIDLNRFADYTFNSLNTLATNTATLTTQVQSLSSQVSLLNDELSGMSTSSLAAAVADAASSTASTSDLASTTLVNALSDMGVLLEKGIAQFNTLVVRDLVFSKDSDGTSAAGSGTILAGNTTVQIQNTHMLSSSQVSVTLTSPMNGNWYVTNKQDGSFQVTISQSQQQDVTFDYLIIQTSGQIATSTPVGQTNIGSFSFSSWLASLFGGAASSTQTMQPLSQPTPAPTGSEQGTGSGTTTTGSSTPGTAPTVTLKGDAAMSVDQGGVFLDPGATATDASGTDISSSIVVTGTVDVNTPGIYTVTYTATDASGNTGSASRVVTVSASASSPAPTSGGSDSGSGSGSGTGSGTGTDTGSDTSSGSDTSGSDASSAGSSSSADTSSDSGSSASASAPSGSDTSSASGSSSGSTDSGSGSGSGN